MPRRSSAATQSTATGQGPAPEADHRARASRGTAAERARRTGRRGHARAGRREQGDARAAGRGAPRPRVGSPAGAARARKGARPAGRRRGGPGDRRRRPRRRSPPKNSTLPTGPAMRRSIPMPRRPGRRAEGGERRRGRRSAPARCARRHRHRQARRCSPDATGRRRRRLTAESTDTAPGPRRPGRATGAGPRARTRAAAAEASAARDGVDPPRPRRHCRTRRRQDPAAVEADDADGACTSSWCRTPTSRRRDARSDAGRRVGVGGARRRGAARRWPRHRCRGARRAARSGPPVHAVLGNNDHGLGSTLPEVWEERSSTACPSRWCTIRRPGRARAHGLTVPGRCGGGVRAQPRPAGGAGRRRAAARQPGVAGAEPAPAGVHRGVASSCGRRSRRARRAWAGVGPLAGVTALVRLTPLP